MLVVIVMDRLNGDENVSGTAAALEMVINGCNMDVNGHVKATGLRRKASLNVTFCVKKERNASLKKVSRILQKSESERSEEEKEVLSSCTEVVKEVSSRLEKRKVLKARSEEVEDTKEVLELKCETLARAVQRARHLVVYSGAGVSTAACIPDYRGSNGIWTRLQQGLDIGQHDLSKTQPTLTHMVLYALYKRGMLKHVVSQNCDGLHLRSGLPRAALSEVHGNMYLEVCQPCKLEYWRLFDVTEHTARYSHATARRCYSCHKPLRDTIVHFGERGGLKWPINWSGATAAANQADVILCIGSSLKVLKKYPWLWGMDRPAKKRPSLYIVNLQWTPKDEQAALKINGKCDEVMAMMMSKLSLVIPDYDSLLDPIFVHATQLHPVETHTYSTSALEPPEELKGSNKRPGDQVSQEQAAKRLYENIVVKEEPIEEENIGVEKEVPSPDIVTKDLKEKNCKSENGGNETMNVKSEDIQKEENNVDTSDAKTHEEDVGKKKELDLIKTAPKADTDKESQHLSPSKSSSKGIWRPFSFDDIGSSTSTGISKTRSDTHLSTATVSVTTLMSQISSVNGSSSTPNNNNALKKCIVQIEPLDLSCGKNKEQNIDKPNPYFCKYCRVHYHSGFCLFYRKHIAENPPDPACYCCDEEDEKDPLSPETDPKSPDEPDKSTAKTLITNPGWFGKGYRKKIRKKR